MRTWLLPLVVGLLFAPGVAAAVEQHRAAAFPMANGFNDVLTVVSGQTAIEAQDITESTGFFRTGGAAIDGLDQACWRTVAGAAQTCVKQPVHLVVPAGSSFGFNSASGFSLHLTAAHGLVTFVDLSKADGFDDRLRVGPSAIASLVDSSIEIDHAAPVAGGRAAFTSLEPGSTIEVRADSGVLLHTVKFDDDPLTIDGSPQFADSITAQILVVPFGEGSTASFKPAAAAAAREGLAKARLDLLDQVLSDVRFLNANAKGTPGAIIERAGLIVSEVFNGAFIRARLSDKPASLGDVAFAKFTELSIKSGTGDIMDFDGSYTLVVGDLGPGFKGTSVGSGGVPVRWWMGILIAVAVAVGAAWFWLREAPMPRPAPGAQTWAARAGTAVGAVLLVLLWDWEMHDALGTSVFTTHATGNTLGVLVAVELASLLLALALIGVPVFFIVRYGLALAKKPQFANLGPTAGVFLTLALGVLVFPALIAFMVNLAA